ncbi:hypothetical protein MCHI_003742, partial [Candidatus Magnetoovum chiemensis]
MIGGVSRKLGTMVEDLVYPSIERIIKEQFGYETDDISLRRKRKFGGDKKKEFDVYALAGNYVFLNSTKSTLTSANVDDFEKDIATFREAFPEYNDRPLIGIVSSLYVDESVITHAEDIGYMVLATGNELKKQGIFIS